MWKNIRSGKISLLLPKPDSEWNKSKQYFSENKIISVPTSGQNTDFPHEGSKPRFSMLSGQIYNKATN